MVAESRLTQSVDAKWFFIPFTNYGIMGITNKTRAEIDEILRGVVARYGCKYNSSTASCQEVGLAVANEATQDCVCLGGMATQLKSVLFITLINVAFLIPLVIRNLDISLSIGYKNDSLTELR
ncbi:hypothetical protein BV898_09782 [Hypsibius exemplaris]|uniref:Uncharacterized protein n=1 Tax=Hypsibius exemplaris TaxID=2072580 RepID=A0A1W0WLV8_HYPEX|nr:hypothetical protein BV898_09782 [Hypsibius exemplaris]